MAPHVTASIKPFDASGSGYEGVFRVDTGIMNSVVPASELTRIGIEPMGRTYDGELFGGALIEALGDVTAGRVIFGAEGTEPILGLTAIESLGIVIDPITQSVTRRRVFRLPGIHPARSR